MVEAFELAVVEEEVAGDSQAEGDFAAGGYGYLDSAFVLGSSGYRDSGFVLGTPGYLDSVVWWVVGGGFGWAVVDDFA